jgi:alanine racemase
VTSPPYRPAWAEIDLHALRQNVRRVRDHAGNVALCAVVKADGYGHGAVAVARAAIEAGAEQLAVALVEEGASLRDAGIDAPILLLSEPPLHAMNEVIARRLIPTVYTSEGIEAAAAAAYEANAWPLRVQLKVDTGMHRVGADPAVALQLARRVCEDGRLVLDAVWTHFAVADEPAQLEFTSRQISRFDDFAKRLADSGITVPARHAANSAGVLYTRASYDLVRAGIALYGYAPDPNAGAMGLEPVLSLRARVSFVKTLDAGEALSYGQRYRLDRRSVIATVPLGYADGVPRRLAEVGGEVLIGGRRHPIAGAVTMDQLLVDCGPDAPVAVGDDVVLIGRQGETAITADDWAARLGTISYEILCGIGARVPRVYLG